MKMIRLTILLLISGFVFNAWAQDELKVSVVQQSPLIPLYDPYLLDSVDVDMKKYDTKRLLETQVDFDVVRKSKDFLKADADGKFLLSYAPYDPKIMYRDKAIQLYRFTIDPDRYCQAELIFTATDRWELYINGKKEKNKEEKQDSLAQAKQVEMTLKLEPQQYEIIIKRLAQVKNFDEAAMTITLKPDKKYKDAELSLSTASQRRITINDIIEGERIASNSLSPSGKYYIIRTSDVLAGGKRNDRMELKDLKTNRTLCHLPTEINPHWLNDEDKFIYSLSGASGKDLFLFDPQTLEYKQIARDISFDSYYVSPDNRFLLLSKNEEIQADKGDLKRVLDPSDRAGSFRGRSTIYMYPLEENAVMQQIIYSRSSVSVVDISPDSRTALIRVSENLNERPFGTNTYFEMDLLNLKMDTLFTDKFIYGGKYSPDGKLVLFTGAAEAFDKLGVNVGEGQIPNLYDSQAYLYNLKTKEVKPITRDFDPSISSAIWSKYDNKLYFRAEDKDRAQVYSYDLSSEKFTRLDLPEDMIASFQLAVNTPVALFRGESASNAYRLYSYDLKSGKSTLLADPFKEQLAELELSAVSDWSFTSKDGSQIDGRYYLPHGYDASKTYPMIVYYYGGTSPTPRIFESTYPLHTYAALGYVVLALNPSGTTGWGQEFSARHVNAWGQITADEIIEGTRTFCDTHPFVDRTKIGCIGASYGGFMTQYLLTQTDLFAAAISHAGISNIASYWGEGYWGYSYSGAATAFNYPWNNPELYTKQSPLFSADKIDTPLLLLHGTADTNVPIGESIQMFNALRILGKEVELIQVQGENHAIYNYKKRIEWNKTIHAWFARWLKEQPEWWNSLYPER